MLLGLVNHLFITFICNKLQESCILYIQFQNVQTMVTEAIIPYGTITKCSINDI